MKKYILVLYSLAVSYIACSQESEHKLFETIQPNVNSLYIGIEYAELWQNNFRNIGKDKFTFLIGQQFGKNGSGKFGWRYMIIDADLSEEHIRNENQVAFIEGNRIDLRGDVHAQRVCLDYYPINIGIGYSKKTDKHILQVCPLLYADIGFNSWGFTNTLYNEEYRLNALTCGGGIRLQSVICDLVFIENPFFDLFTYLARNRSVTGIIGDTNITRPEHFGIFGWATIGIKIPLK